MSILDNPQPPTAAASDFETELISLINRYSKENESGTPDFILAQFILVCIEGWNKSVAARERWYGRKK